MIEFFLNIEAGDLEPDGTWHSWNKKESGNPALMSVFWKKVSWQVLPRIDEWVTFCETIGGNFVTDISHDILRNIIVVQIRIPSYDFIESVYEELSGQDDWIQSIDAPI